MGKGSGRRPCLVSRAEEDLRWDLKEGKISLATFKKKIKKLKENKK